MKDYGPGSNKGFRYNLVKIGNFSKYGWTTSSKIKCAQTTTDAFSQICRTSKREPNLLKKDDGKKNVNEISDGFLKQKF